MKNIARHVTKPTFPTIPAAPQKKGRPRTGGIYRRGGVFWLRYQIDKHLVRESLGVATEREARAEAARRLAPIRAADHVETLRAVAGRLKDAEAAADAAYDAAHPSMTFLTGWAEYLKTDAVPAGGATLAQYEGHWFSFAKWLAQNYPQSVAAPADADETWKPEDTPERAQLRAVTPEMAAGFIKNLVARGMTGQRINKYLQFLRAAFAELQKTAHLAGNPFDGIKRRKQNGTSKRPLTTEEVRAAIEKAEDEIKTLLMLGAFLGLRFGDCCTLQWGEVDARRGIIRRIPRKTAYKGEAAAVVVGIPAVLGAHLAELPRAGRYVVPGLAGEYLAGRAPQISNRIQEIFQAAGITTVKDGTGKGTGKRAVVLAGFHSLRHFYISTLAQAGAPMGVLQKLAGHGSPIMTDHYLHLTPEAARLTAEKMPALLGTGKQGKGAPVREPLPAWAIAELRKMTGKNWAKVRGAMLQ